MPCSLFRNWGWYLCGDYEIVRSIGIESLNEDSEQYVYISFPVSIFYIVIFKVQTAWIYADIYAE